MWSPILLLAAWIACVGGHGRVFVPPSRASAWRFGFGTPADYDDDGWNCGGYAVQHAANGGKCGICGDAYNLAQPRPHELGGVYGQGVLVAGYLPGSLITTTVDLTTSHRGFWEFKLCTDPQSNHQDCFDKYVLELEEGGTKYYPNRGSTQYNVTYRLPKGLVCEHCVLQWRYTAGNNWGTCDNGTQGLGCGPQEQFGACSDIYIGTTKKHTRLVLEDARETDEHFNPWFFLSAPAGLLGMFRNGVRATSTKPQQQSTTTNAHGQTQTTNAHRQTETTNAHRQTETTNTHRQTQTTKVQQQKPTEKGQRQTHTTNAIQQTPIKNLHQESQVLNSQRQHQVENAKRLSQTTKPLQQTQLSNAQRQTQAVTPQRVTQTTNSFQHTQRQTHTTPTQRQAHAKPTTKQHNSEPTPSTQFITQLNHLLAQSLQHQKYNIHQTNKGTETTRHTSQKPWTTKHHPHSTEPITKTHRHRPTTQRVKKPSRHTKQRDKTRQFHQTTQPSHTTRHRTPKYHRPFAFSNHKAHKKNKQKLKAMRSKHGENYLNTKNGKKVKDKKRKKKIPNDHHPSTQHYSKKNP